MTQLDYTHVHYEVDSKSLSQTDSQLMANN